MNTQPTSNDIKQCKNLSDIFPPVGHELPAVNQALLEGAMNLMGDIYTLDGKPYVPTSYSQNSKTTRQTGYVIHSKCVSFVSWGKKNSLFWISLPQGDFSGTVLYAGPEQKQKAPLNSFCFTDCSGFITALFTYVNLGPQISTQFTDWKSESNVPEAGCFTESDDPDYIKPNPVNFFKFIKNKDCFGNVPVQNLQPGDLIVKANSKNHDDTGHIMLVTSVCRNKDEYWVIVIDETGDCHSCDTRVNPDKNLTIGGLGMGIVKLCATNKGVDFYWDISQEKPNASGPDVVLGCAL